MNANFVNPNLPTTISFAPMNPVPDDAPPMKLDVYNPNLSAEDIFQSNYLSLEGLTAWLEARDAESRILTIVHVSMELLYDPVKEKPKDGEWKPVLWFEEIESGLVVNLSRSQLLTKLAKSPQLAAWAKLGQVAIKPGLANGKGQIIITAVPIVQAAAPTNGKASKPTKTVADINDDLFGSN